jgi:hypothetical protein
LLWARCVWGYGAPVGAGLHLYLAVRLLGRQLLSAEPETKTGWYRRLFWLLSPACEILQPSQIVIEFKRPKDACLLIRISISTGGHGECRLRSATRV